MSAKFTPGPWSIRTEFGKLCIRPGDYNAKGYSSGYAPIAKVAGDKRINNDEANARLIAAAPDLLQALQLLLIVVDAPDDDPDIVRAKNAVAKATGEPQ